MSNALILDPPALCLLLAAALALAALEIAIGIRAAWRFKRRKERKP